MRPPSAATSAPTTLTTEKARIPAPLLLCMADPCYVLPCQTSYPGEGKLHEPAIVERKSGKDT